MLPSGHLTAPTGHVPRPRVQCAARGPPWTLSQGSCGHGDRGDFRQREERRASEMQPLSGWASGSQRFHHVVWEREGMKKVHREDAGRSRMSAAPSLQASPLRCPSWVGPTRRKLGPLSRSPQNTTKNSACGAWAK